MLNRFFAFQQLSKREARGNVKSYNVRYWTTEHTSSVKTASVSAHTNQISLQLSQDLAYMVTIEAETDVGLNTTLVATRVWIPKSVEGEFYWSFTYIVSC